MPAGIPDAREQSDVAPSLLRVGGRSLPATVQAGICTLPMLGLPADPFPGRRRERCRRAAPNSGVTYPCSRPVAEILALSLFHADQTWSVQAPVVGASTLSRRGEGPSPKIAWRVEYQGNAVTGQMPPIFLRKARPKATAVSL